MSKPNEGSIWKEWPTYVVAVMLVAMPVGVGLALYFNDANWLILTLVAFIFFMAG